MMPQSWIGKTIGGRYQMDALLGQGGMSAVYRATDPNLRRVVAIKLIHTHLSTDPNFVGRFKEEAAAVARLRHPNIVQVHDFNIDGETYYMVMEYLVGETLQARLRRLNASGRHMPLDEVLRLCIQLCEAVGYAHNHELVHRDIKPANIMLDIQGQAILMDFGIVKILGGDYHTATGATIGTAMYMSPEQIRAERIDERADIYSLGVTLYEMISGRPPYTADSALTVMMMVLNDPLPDLHTIRAGLPASLLAAVNQALAKDRVQRFQNMAEMTAALRQAQADLTSAPPQPAPTMVEKAQIEPAAPPTMPGTIKESLPEGGFVKFSKAEQPQAISPSVELPPPPVKNSAVPTLQEAALNVPAAKVTTTAPKARWIISLTSPCNLLIAASLLLLAVLVTLGLVYLNTRKPPGIQLAPIERPPEPINAQTAPMMVNLGRWETGAFVEEIAYSPDSSLLGTANNRDWVKNSKYKFYSGLWQVQAGRLQTYLLGHSQWIYEVAFSPDNQLFGSVSDDNRVCLWQVTDGSLVREIIGEDGGFTSLSFSPNNLLLAASAWDGTVSLWEISSGNLLRTFRETESGIKDVDFSPDGALLAAASDNNSIFLWRVSDGSLVHALQDHTAPAFEVAFSPDGSLLASASEDHTIKIWQVGDGSLVESMQGHTEPIYDVAFSPDGSLLASAAGDGTLRLWQVSDGTLLKILTEYTESIKCVDFSPDGYLLASGAADGVIQFWGISEAIPTGND